MREDLLNRRRLSYYMNDWDDLNLPYTENYNNIEEQVIQFFHNGSDLVFPAKTYFVAIVYAKCMEKFFNVDFYESLNDKELLPDMIGFKPYDEDKKIYDYIIEKIGDIWYYNSINKTVSYFKKEFLIK